jgi:hypothetical protein
MLIGGGGAAVAAVGGWFVFLRDSGGGPEGVVKSYYSAGSNGNFEQAASLVHEDSPSRDSLTHFGDVNPDEVDVSADNVEPFNESEAAGFSYNATVQEFEILDVTTIISNSETTTGQQGSETTTLTWWSQKAPTASGSSGSDSTLRPVAQWFVSLSSEPVTQESGLTSRARSRAGSKSSESATDRASRRIRSASATCNSPPEASTSPSTIVNSTSSPRAP